MNQEMKDAYTSIVANGILWGYIYILAFLVSVYFLSILLGALFAKSTSTFETFRHTGYPRRNTGYNHSRN